MLPQDDVRKVIGEVNDIRKKVRAEQYSASDVMNMVDNLHDAEETECVYIDDVNGGELSKEKVVEARKCELDLRLTRGSSVSREDSWCAMGGLSKRRRRKIKTGGARVCFQGRSRRYFCSHTPANGQQVCPF